MLDVKKSTCDTCNVDYHDLGRIPLEMDSKRKIFKYWLKIRKSKNCTIRACYQDMTETNDAWIMSDSIIS